MLIDDSQFQLKVVLIFNPKLKPESRKPLEDEIQQAKILYYFPLAAEIQEKRNHVGLAQGLFCFFDALDADPLPGEAKQQVFYTSSDIFIIKEMEPDIWLFIGLLKCASYNFVKVPEEYVTKESHNYSYESITQDICYNFLQHFYDSFVLFQGTITNLVSTKEKVAEFGRIMTEFIGRYVLLNENQTTKKLDSSYYLFGGVRLTPLDPNYLLKFNYFQSIMQTLDAGCRDMIIFYGGYLVYNTMSPELAYILYNYYYGMGEPFKFQDTKIKKKFSNLETFKGITKVKYGYFVNSLNYGSVQKKELKKDSKNEFRQSKSEFRESKSEFRESKSELKHKDSKEQDNIEVTKSFDLLGLQDNTQASVMDVYVKQEGSLTKYGLNTFMSGKILMLSFCSNVVRQIERIQLQNRFFQDNVERFNEKLSSVLIPLANQVRNPNIQQQFHRFVYINRVNMGGKMTMQLSDNVEMASAVRMIFSKLNNCVEDCVLVTTSVNWLYGIRRMNRILVVAISNEIGLHKIEDYMDRLSKEYFANIYI